MKRKQFSLDAGIKGLRELDERYSIVVRGIRYQQRNLSFTLSVRETEVLKLLAQGFSNKEIAVRMRLSPSTVKRHVENILRRLHLRNRVEAAVYAVTKSDLGV